MTGEPSLEKPNSTEKSKWYLSTWGVAILLASLGPIGFPFLWKSSKFNRAWKWAITVGVVVLTAVLGWSAYVSIKMLLELLRSLGFIS